jgi:hypothetical protein
MASDGDAENQTSVNEQTPLLDGQADQPLDRNKDEHRHASFYVWRVFGAIAAALVIGIFVKGWIDGSDYVDVGTTT